MSKTKFYNEVMEGLNEVFSEHAIDNEAKVAVLSVVDNVLKPKTLRSSSETTIVDENGDVVAILDIHSKFYLPATEEFFYTDRQGKGINGLKRISKIGEHISKKHKAAKDKEIASISAKVLSGELDREVANAKIEEIKAQKPDFSEMEQYAYKA
ncbi:TPA: hypothetical protein R4958_001429 [Campylobacter jejuni]|nr:hypothetical protein [Campylobacter jejuni]